MEVIIDNSNKTIIQLLNIVLSAVCYILFCYYTRVIILFYLVTCEVLWHVQMCLY